MRGTRTRVLVPRTTPVTKKDPPQVVVNVVQVLFLTVGSGASLRLRTPGGVEISPRIIMRRMLIITVNAAG
jgi:hypothetical protein